ncbi:MAG: virginiamycin B lyase family protein, partial [Nitrososphaerales archaeon]
MRLFISSKSALALIVLLLVTLTLLPALLPSLKMQMATAYSSGSDQQTTYQIIQHTLPNGSSEPWAITTDNAGRVWFVEQGSNQLGMLEPLTGNITEYSIPTPNSTVISVATDGLGNVWLTELTANKLGELESGSTSIVEYPVPGAPYQIAGHMQFQSCGPSGVVPDSSGRIWVICIFSNQIDEFFPGNGTFLSFDLPVYQSGPAGLVFDRQGNFWFTAADADMLGHGVVSQLQNGTSNGITEFAPKNQTYSFTFEHALGPLGPYQNDTSSLPTPSGISLAPDGNTLWITEHVDSSFDSYNIQSKNLVRYWTSKTNGAFGYSVSFPNGIAVDKEGNVWISEHYGNKIAEFNPNSQG